jgi:NAD+ synthase (glutamine-hydrolysing)
MGVAVCEDIWNHSTLAGRPLYADDPLEDLAAVGVRVVLNPSASPFVLGKPEFRERMLADVARDLGAAVLFVNQVGGNDELVFDGGSLVVDATGRTRARCPLFEESLLVAEVGEDGSATGDDAPWPGEREDHLIGAIRLGLRDYVVKCGFTDVLLGLSGGIDSALVATLAAGALGSDHVTALAMPSVFSSEASLDDARELASNLGIRLVTVPIGPVYDALVSALEPHFGGRPFDVTEENLQARVRGTLLMAFSNKLGGLVLATGNKSEIAVGYCTLYGDTVGALAPIGDLLKTEVYALARRINAGGEVIPRSIIDKPPSAELRPDQTDQDSLPPYEELDLVLRRAFGGGVQGDVEQAASGETTERVLAMVRQAEHKRSQAPLVLKLSPRAFGPGRRYPIAQGFRE